MADSHTYETSLSWINTRRGLLSSDGLADLEVATPPQFPGGIAGIWSPEHLFVASAEVCIMTTFLAIAENSKIDFVSYSSEAAGTLEKTESGYQITSIVVKAHVRISDDSKVERVTRILGKAEENCLISNSMKAAVHLEPTVTVG